MALLLPACQKTSEPPLSPKDEVQHSPHEDSKESPKLDQEESPKTPQEVLKPISFETITLDKYLDIFAQLDCPDCPNSIGQIVTHHELKQGYGILTGTSSCQGGLIGEDLFLTSRHCLAPKTQNIGDSCRGNTVVVLPRINDKFPLKVLDCDHLVSVSNTYDGLPEREIQPDWAILKLSESLPERFSEPTIKGIEDEEKVFGFLPLENPKTGEVIITTIQCQGIQKSRLFPVFQNTQSPLAFLECDRKMGEGFSGIILFRFKPNNGYTPVATLSHAMLAEDISNTSSLSSGENVHKSFSKYISASQTACISSDEADKSDSCHFDPNQRSLLDRQLFINSLNEAKIEIDGILSPLVQDKNQPIQWERVHLENWETLPEDYLSFFHETLRKINVNPISSKEVKTRFLQNLVPVYAQCVRPEFIDNEDPYSKIPIQVPITRVYIQMDEYYRVIIQYEIMHMEAYLVPKRKDPSGKTSSLEDLKFTIRSNSEAPPYNPPKDSMLNGRFYHFSKIVPICK